MKKRFWWIFILIFICGGMEILKISLYDCLSLPNEFYVNYDEIQKTNNQGRFGKFVKLGLTAQSTSGGREKNEGYVIVRLFGFIPIKKIKAKILPQENVYVGGELVGITVECDGMVVVSNCTIDENSGEIIKNSFLKNGDVISKINDKDIKELSDIQSALLESEGQVNLEIVRDSKKIQQTIPLLKDKKGEYKLGIWGKDEISGVGTLTFVKSDNSFGALGHAITSGANDNTIPIKEGKLYSCNLVGIKKGERNLPGELRCLFLPRNAKGEINKNTRQGIYGKIANESGLIDPNVSLPLGGRLSVKNGKAKIISCVSGIREEYDIEIIKANYQNSINEKSIVFRVVDNRLLNLTGGIVQGMSGSPIVQDGKIVGAVTHVFFNDPTKGYGVYTDWMLEQMEE